MTQHLIDFTLNLSLLTLSLSLYQAPRLKSAQWHHLTSARESNKALLFVRFMDYHDFLG